MTTLDRRQLLPLLAAALLPVDASAEEALPLADLPGRVEAPEFALPDLSGNVLRLSEYRGRPILVNFWAVWCPPCRRELKELADLRNKLAGTGFEILAINLGDNAERIATFLARYPAPALPILLDTHRATASPWHVAALPVAYALDRSGILRLGAIGERDWHSPHIEKQLRSLIAQ
jgi:peroxiredoxin